MGGEASRSSKLTAMASPMRAVVGGILIVASLSEAAQSKMCNMCQSFIDATPKASLEGVSSSLTKGDCNNACLNMQNGKDMINCAVLCKKVGSQGLMNVVDAGCDSLCDGAIAMLQVETAAQNASRAKPGNVTINGDMTVTGSLKAKAIKSTALLVNGSMTVTHSVRAEFLKVENAKASVVETSTVSSATGTVQLTGNLGVSRGAGGSGASLQAEALHTESLIQLGQKQWALVHHDHFENDHENWSDGSSFIQVSDANGDRFMGGHCNFAAGTMSKKYELPEHSHLRVQARAHFIDSWEGESAFLQLDDKTVWSQSVDARNSKGLNIAGGDHPEHKWGDVIDVVVPHSAPTVFLEFGSTLDQHACDESFGVDDVMVHVL